MLPAACVGDLDHGKPSCDVWNSARGPDRGCDARRGDSMTTARRGWRPDRLCLCHIRTIHVGSRAVGLTGSPQSTADRSKSVLPGNCHSADAAPRALRHCRNAPWPLPAEHLTSRNYTAECPAWTAGGHRRRREARLPGALVRVAWPRSGSPPRSAVAVLDAVEPGSSVVRQKRIGLARSP